MRVGQRRSVGSRCGRPPRDDVVGWPVSFRLWRTYSAGPHVSSASRVHPEQPGPASRRAAASTFELLAQHFETQPLLLGNGQLVLDLLEMCGRLCETLGIARKEISCRELVLQ